MIGAKHANARQRKTARSAPLGAKVLFTGEFGDAWAAHARATIRRFAAHFDLVPLVLLPHDIQAEVYERRYELLIAEAADEALASYLAPRAAHEPRLVFIDFAPDLLPGDRMLLDLLNVHLQNGWASDSVLVVQAPVNDALDETLFDERLRF